MVGTSAAGLLVAQQGPQCLPRLEKAGVDERRLKLLNVDYEIDGVRYRLGVMTPRQVEDEILSNLLDQRKALMVRSDRSAPRSAAARNGIGRSLSNCLSARCAVHGF